MGAAQHAPPFFKKSGFHFEQNKGEGSLDE
jgi:hypothetical protein